MIVYDGLDDPGLKPADRVVAVGAFDGVHRGHQRLLAHICRIAADYGARSAIMTFEPIPAEVFRRDDGAAVRLTTRDERVRELSKYCVSDGVIADFNADFRRMSALDFARDVLVERLGVVALVASKTHTFGRNAEADVQAIAELGMELGFEVHVLPPILEAGERINSTELRARLLAGNVAGANQWLGRPYDLAGEVRPGHQVGRSIGFPTANLTPPAEKLVPADGVYACAARVEVDGAAQSGWIPAAVSIGGAPTFGNDERTIEAYLLTDDSPDLYGEWVRLQFLQRLRDNVRFDSTDELVRQMQRDVETVRNEYGASLAV